MVQLNGKEVGNIGFGLMGFTWRATPTPPEKAIPVMKAALNAGNKFWNGGEFYGTPEYNSLHLLNAYFTKYPEDADKVILSIKGGSDVKSLTPDGTDAGIKRSIGNTLDLLGGKKYLDMFEQGRVDPNVPIDQSVGSMAEFVKAGKMGGISLSEVSANSIRKAAGVHKISGVEVEFSLFATEIMENGVMDACAELNIPIIAYSPLGRGFLTGQVKKYEDLPEGDNRRMFPRFQPGNFEHNVKLANEVDEVAKRKGCTPGQVAMAWIMSFNGKPGFPPIIPIPGSTTEERVLENTKEVTLTTAEINELSEIVKRSSVAGARYPEHLDKLSFA